MKPSFIVLFTFFLCSFTNVIFAQTVDINTAKDIAEHHISSISRSTLKSKSLSGKSFQFTSVKAAVENKDTLYYILNDTINKGFVIVSADKRAWPILGYSTTDCIDENNQPEAFKTWIGDRKKEIQEIKKSNLQADKVIKEKWQNVNLKRSTIETSSVEPLIQTQWDQGCYYNAMCPADQTSNYCRRVPVGCTITAMAQIMKYWNFPTKGVGSYSYLHPTYDNLSADFGSTTYQWSQMPNKVTSQNDAVATLMYHCGVALNTNYGPSASAADDPRDELVKYFNYSSNAILINRSGFKTQDWIQLLKSELDLGHPIWYMGSSTVGHSFICDGYQGEDYFHFNWGWSGSSDGYYYIGNLNPGWYNFNNSQFALINLVPGNLPDDYNGFFLSSNALDITSKGGSASVDVCSSKEWTAKSDQAWISLSTNKGASGKTTLTLTADRNSTGNIRSAIVTISADGFKDQKLTVTQLTSIEVTPGNLYNLISENATSITKLTLTGYIDVRDFKTMRDAMPALTDLDLSDVTIVSYTDEENFSSVYTYPANEIPWGAFYIIPCQGQNLLKSIILPKTLTSIGIQAFGNSKYLTTIEISSLVNSIASRAFELCNAFINVDSNNPNYSSIDGVLFNKNQTQIIQCPISKTGDYTIPSSVTSIAERAFTNCAKLTTITIPSSVKSIGSLAFNECVGLTNVNISSSVTTIGEMAFWGCNLLDEIYIPSSVTSIGNAAFSSSKALINVDAANSKYSSIDGVLFNKAQAELIHCPTSIKDEFIIPSTVSSISSGAFSNCHGLTSMDIPSSVISIGSTAFSNCYNLKSLIIPSSVVSIGSQAFWGCAKLESIYSYNIFPLNFDNSSNVFNEVNKKSCTLYVPFGSKTLYGNSIQWKDFKKIVEIPGIFFSKNELGLDSKGDTAQVVISSSAKWSATADQPWLTVNPSEGNTGYDTITFIASENLNLVTRTATVTISATDAETQTITITQTGIIEVTAGNLKNILAGQLSSITHLTLSGTIDASDFKTMRDEMPVLSDINLKDVTIVAYSGDNGPDFSITKYYPAHRIPNYAFCTTMYNRGKASLKSITLPSNLMAIGNNAFLNCGRLTNIIIPPSVNSIGDDAFASCISLPDIFISSNISFIGRTAFNIIPNGINVDPDNRNYSSIDGVLFNKSQTKLIKCPTSKTGSYIIPSTVTTICNAAFGGCTGLTDITIPSSVTTIEKSAFGYCDGLTSIDLSSSVISLGRYAFVECEYLETITIPASITTIEYGALSGCIKLKSIYTLKETPPVMEPATRVFFQVDFKKCILYVPFGSKILYASATLWKDFENIVELASPAPVANSGIDFTVDEGEIVTLDGSESYDPNNDSIYYSWIAPYGITLDSATSVRPIFRAPEVSSDTVFIFSLIVNDGTTDSNADEVMITVKNVNKIPVANAGIDMTVIEGDTITLDGSASYDPDGDSISYLWLAPDGITLNKSDIANPIIIVPEVDKETKFPFILSVNDNQYTSEQDTVIITVEKKVKPDNSELISYGQICIYPNPSKGLIEISMEKFQEQAQSVEVYNSIGQLVLKIKPKTNVNRVNINLSELRKGIYTLRVSVGEKHYQQKIIRE